LKRYNLSNSIFEKIQSFPRETKFSYGKPSFSPLFFEKGQGRDTRKGYKKRDGYKAKPSL